MENEYEFSAESGVRKKNHSEESEYVGNLTWTINLVYLRRKTDWIKNKIHPVVCKKKVKMKLLILKEFLEFIFLHMDEYTVQIQGENSLKKALMQKLSLMQ